MSILECKALTKRYGGKSALEGVELSIEPGRIVGLLGPNGSGKTTLIKLANGLLTPTSGEILIDGKAPSPETKAIVSYLPARNGRHGHLYTWEGVINIKNEKYARDERPIDPECHCPVCRKYSRAYLRHLMKAEEILALRFCVMHNLFFYNSLMEKIRAALDEGQYQAFHDRYVEKLDKRI